VPCPGARDVVLGRAARPSQPHAVILSDRIQAVKRGAGWAAALPRLERAPGFLRRSRNPNGERDLVNVRPWCIDYVPSARPVLVPGRGGVTGRVSGRPGVDAAARTVGKRALSGRAEQVMALGPRPAAARPARSPAPRGRCSPGRGRAPAGTPRAAEPGGSRWTCADDTLTSTCTRSGSPCSGALSWSRDRRRGRERSPDGWPRGWRRGGSSGEVSSSSPASVPGARQGREGSLRRP
jgi:hypothetical protein